MQREAAVGGRLCPAGGARCGAGVRCGEGQRLVAFRAAAETQLLLKSMPGVALTRRGQDQCLLVSRVVSACGVTLAAGPLGQGDSEHCQLYLLPDALYM